MASINKVNEYSWLKLFWIQNNINNIKHFTIKEQLVQNWCRGLLSLFKQIWMQLLECFAVWIFNKKYTHTEVTYQAGIIKWDKNILWSVNRKRSFIENDWTHYTYWNNSHKHRILLKRQQFGGFFCVWLFVCLFRTFAAEQSPPAPILPLSKKLSNMPTALRVPTNESKACCKQTKRVWCQPPNL